MAESRICRGIETGVPCGTPQSRNDILETALTGVLTGEDRKTICKPNLAMTFLGAVPASPTILLKVDPKVCPEPVTGSHKTNPEVGPFVT